MPNDQAVKTEEDRLLVEATKRARERLGISEAEALIPVARAARGSQGPTYRNRKSGSPEPLASILERWQQRLSTTGDQPQGSEGSNSTGPQPGATGAGESANRTAVVVRHPANRGSSSPTKPPVPLTNKQLIELLARLDAMTKHRTETPEQQALRLTCYREDLRAFDGEAVRKAIQSWPDTHDWWPSWAELRKEIEEWS